jgi:hypothetical protein
MTFQSSTELTHRVAAVCAAAGELGGINDGPARLAAAVVGGEAVRGAGSEGGPVRAAAGEAGHAAVGCRAHLGGQGGAGWGTRRSRLARPVTALT